MRGRGDGAGVFTKGAAPAAVLVVLCAALTAACSRPPGAGRSEATTGAGIEAAEVTNGVPNSPRTVLLHSRILGEQRRLYVRLPEGYDGSELRYPVLVVLDGDWLFGLAQASAAFYSELDATGVAIPRMIVVGIENVDRDRDFTPTRRSGQEFEFATAGGADRFLAFLADEVVPHLDAEYRTGPGRFVAGWSFGGLLATYAAVANPDLFDGHLCISPAVWWDDDLVVRTLPEARFDRPKRMVFTLGTEEEGGLVAVATKALLRRLGGAPVDNLDVTSVELSGTGHGWSIPGAFDRGLRRLFAGYVPPDGAVSSPEALSAYYDRLSQSWGFTVAPPACAVVAMAAATDDKDGAVAMLDRLLASDPDAAMAHFTKGKLQLALGRRAEARASFEAALAAERRRSVPQTVYVSGFEKAVASLEEGPGAEPAGS